MSRSKSRLTDNDRPAKCLEVVGQMLPSRGSTSSYSDEERHFGVEEEWEGQRVGEVALRLSAATPCHAAHLHRRPAKEVTREDHDDIGVTAPALTQIEDQGPCVTQ